MNRYHAAAIVLFVVLSIFISRIPMTTPGFHKFWDKPEKADLTAFRDDFLSLYKSGQGPSLDSTKRIFLEWIFLFIDEEQFAVIMFPLLALSVVLIAYFCFLRFIEEEYKVGEGAKQAIAFVAAFFYLANPLSLEHFISLYPEISYALFPAAFYTLYMTLKSNDIKYPVLFGALSLFLFTLVIHNALYLAIMAACMAVAALAQGRAALTETAKKYLAAVLVFTALGMFIILPTAYMWANTGSLPGPDYINSAEAVIVYGGDTRMLYVMLLDLNLLRTASFSYDYPAGDSYYIVMALIASLVIGYGIWRPNPLAGMSALNIAVFAFLANGINSPAGWLYEYAALNLPLGWLIRASGKFSFLMPMFFAALIVHFLASAWRQDRKGFAAATILLLAVQSIYSYPLWSGDLGGGIKKMPANEDLVNVIDVLKNDTDELGRIVWFGDNLVSSPRDYYSPGGKSSVAITYLMTNPDPGGAVSGLARALEIKYILIDKDPSLFLRPYLPGMGNTMKDIGKNNTVLYNGPKYKLFLVNEDLQRFYIPKAVFIVYSGFDAAQGISAKAPIGRDIAMVMADDMPGIAESAGPYADIAVFDSKNAVTDFKDGDLIVFGKEITSVDPSSGWAQGKSGFSSLRTSWLRFAEKSGLTVDQGEFRLTVVYTGTPIVLSEGSVPPLFAVGDLSLSDPKGGEILERDNKTIFRLGNASAGDYRHFRARGDLKVRDMKNFDVYVNFYGKDGRYLERTAVVSGRKADTKFEKDFSISTDADWFRVVVEAKNGSADADLIVKDLRISGLESGPNRFVERFEAAEGGEYDVFVRVLKSPKGGALRMSVNNGSAMELETRSERAGFDWVKVHSGRLEEGENTIEVENAWGINAVNVGYYLPQGERSGYLKDKGIFYIYQGEDEFETARTVIVKDERSSNGRAISLGPGSKAWAPIYIYESRNYHLEPGGQNVTVAIDGKPAGGIVYLERGAHTLNVSSGNGTGKLDYILIYDDKAKAVFEGLKNGSMAKGEVVSYNASGEASYELYVKVDEPALLVFTNGYEPNFVAVAEDGESSKPIPAFSILNAFPLERTGEYGITVRYRPQDWFETGLVITLASAAGIVAYFFWRRNHG
jgi:hypothetical protein